jgi:hypothetical protein
MGDTKMYRLSEAASPANKAKAQPKAKLRGKAKAKSKVPLLQVFASGALTERPCLWSGSSQLPLVPASEVSKQMEA